MFKFNSLLRPPGRGVCVGGKKSFKVVRGIVIIIIMPRVCVVSGLSLSQPFLAIRTTVLLYYYYCKPWATMADWQ